MCCVLYGVCELFGETICIMFVILLLNVMELCVVRGTLLDRPCMVFHRMCVLCLWSSEHLDAPSICFRLCFLYVGSNFLI